MHLSHKTKNTLMFIPVLIAIMGLFGITQIPLPQFAFASDLDDLGDSISLQIHTLAQASTKADRTLYLKDLEQTRSMHEAGVQNYEEQLRQTETVIMQLQKKDEDVPIFLDQRRTRYQQYIEKGNKRLEESDERILEQQHMMDGANFNQETQLLIGLAD